MGIVLRIGYNDHHLVADFLANRPAGVSGIVVEAKHVYRHSSVIEAARDAGVDVVVETLTDRLAVEGYDPGMLDYADSYPFGPDQLGSLAARAEFVERVVEPQLDLNPGTVVAPHHFSDDAEALGLNLELARLTVHEYGSDFQVTAVCSVRRTLLAEPNAAREAAERYSEAGVNRVELRLSPLGGPREGIQKVKSVFDNLRALREYNVPVTFGFQGIIGEVAYALGLADSYSTGIGDREQYDFKSAIASQQRNAEARRNGEKRRSRRAAPRVLLTGAGVQVSAEVAKALYGDPAIRARLACRLGSCADSIDGPTQDPKQHFLHSRAHSIQEIDRLPPGWRMNHERDQLQKAIELCETINSHHLKAGMKKVEVRTLESLRASLDQLWPQRNTA